MTSNPAGKSVAIVQSNYIPWKGYFDLIASVDEFILCDDLQYTRRDWRNRNKIKTREGTAWLSVPVKATGNYDAQIRAIKLDGTDWAKKHLKAMELNYKRSRYFADTMDSIIAIYRKPPDYLSELNRWLIEKVCQRLSINTTIKWSWEYDTQGTKTERLLSLCKAAGATDYISGPAAKSYIVEEHFQAAGVALSWFDYSDYPEYPQLWGPFVHEVTVLDLLFNTGPDARQYMKFVAR